MGNSQKKLEILFVDNHNENYQAFNKAIKSVSKYNVDVYHGKDYVTGVQLLEENKNKLELVVTALCFPYETGSGNIRLGEKILLHIRNTILKYVEKTNPNDINAWGYSVKGERRKRMNRDLEKMYNYLYSDEKNQPLGFAMAAEAYKNDIYSSVIPSDNDDFNSNENFIYLHPMYHANKKELFKKLTGGKYLGNYPLFKDKINIYYNMTGIFAASVDIEDKTNNEQWKDAIKTISELQSFDF